MKRNIANSIILISLLLVSCQSNEEFMGGTSTVNATLNLSSSENNIWHNSTIRSATDSKDLYYVLDANGLCQTASKTNHGTAGNAEKLLVFGDYSVFCITNADPTGFPYAASMIGTDFTSYPMVLNTLTDVSFGKQPLTILASKTNYDINVTVNHILATGTLPRLWCWSEANS